MNWFSGEINRASFALRSYDTEIMTIRSLATANTVGNMIPSYKSPPSPKFQTQKNRPSGRFFMQRLGLGARRERWLTEAKISEQAECS
jgi:hypothetical protein